MAFPATSGRTRQFRGLSRDFLYLYWEKLTRNCDGMVGATGFEPATSWSQTKCSTRLSYAPTSGWHYSIPTEFRNLNRQTPILLSRASRCFLWNSNVAHRTNRTLLYLPEQLIQPSHQL